jgi:Zn finger protein HypA/HybF involved in hydrogenase expression
MARVTKKEMKMQEVIIDSYLVCDKCGKRIKQESSYDAFECKFVYKTGDIYPEGGSGEKQELDLCQKCGYEAMKLLKNNGFNVREIEWDYWGA